MVMTDPIADFLNRIMNAQRARFDRVDIPDSNLKTELARLLKQEGYIKHYTRIKDDRQGILRVHLRYTGEREGVIEGMKRISKPSRRVYVGHGDIPKVLNGMGVAILSTSKGLMTDRQARDERVGGELLCSVW